MKKNLFRLVLFIMLASMVIGAFSGCSQNNDDKPFVVKNGVIVDYVPRNADTLERLVIPSSIDGQTITGIDEEVFQNGIAMCEEISIPNTIEWIGENAFLYSEIKKVYYRGTIDDWASIRFLDESENPLHDAELYINDVLVKEVNLTTAKVVKAYSFYEAKNIEKITISGQVEKIEELAFYSMADLKEMTIGDSVTEIEERGVYVGEMVSIRCQAQAKPDGWHDNWIQSDNSNSVIWNYPTNNVRADGYVEVVVDDIKYLVKDGSAVVPRQSYNKQSLVIPSTITYNGNSHAVNSISKSAFKDNETITSVVIPTSVVQIGEYAFYGAKNLTRVTYLGTREQFTNVQIDWAILYGTKTNDVIHCSDGDVIV